MKRETLALFLTKNSFRLQLLHYYRSVQMLQTFKKGALDPSMDGMLEIQLSRSMICHVSNTRWNTEYVCPVPSDIVCGVVFVKGAALCNVTILIGHTWWIVVIPPVTHSEMVLIVNYKRSRNAPWICHRMSSVVFTMAIGQWLAMED